MVGFKIIRPLFYLDDSYGQTERAPLHVYHRIIILRLEDIIQKNRKKFLYIVHARGWEMTNNFFLLVCVHWDLEALKLASKDRRITPKDSLDFSMLGLQPQDWVNFTHDKKFLYVQNHINHCVPNK